MRKILEHELVSLVILRTLNHGRQLMPEKNNQVTIPMLIFDFC